MYAFFWVWVKWNVLYLLLVFTIRLFFRLEFVLFKIRQQFKIIRVTQYVYCISIKLFIMFYCIWIFHWFYGLFVWGLSSQSRIFSSFGDVTITVEGLHILTYAPHLWSLIFNVPKLLWHGPSSHNGHLRG